MDICHAPDAEYLDIGIDGKTVTNAKVLELYHNGPSWGRLTWEKKEERTMKKGEKTVKIAAMLESGATVAAICKELGVSAVQVRNTSSREKAAGKAKKRAELLHMCDEIEAAAKYQLALAAMIREWMK